jgi:hypothetical protein
MIRLALGRTETTTLYVPGTVSLEVKQQGHKADHSPPPNIGAIYPFSDWLGGLVVRVSGYRSRGPGFDSRHYQIFWEVVGLEQGPVSLVSTTEELLGRKSSDSGLENREHGCRDLLCWPRNTLYLQKLVLISPISGSRLVGIAHSQTKGTEFFYTFILHMSSYHGAYLIKPRCYWCSVPLLT